MKKFSKILVIVFLFAIVLSAILILAFRNTLYLNEYNPSFLVSINQEVEGKDEVFSTMKSLSHISSIDTNTFQVSLQNTTDSEVRADISAKQLTDSVRIQEIHTERSMSNIMNIAIVLYIVIFLVSAGGIFLFNIKNQKRNVYRISSRTNSIYFDSTVASIIVITGLLVLVSRVYEVKVIDLAAYLISALTGSFVMFTATSKMRFIQIEKVQSINAEVVKVLHPLMNRDFIILLILIIPLSFGLSAAFVLPTALLVAGYLITIASFYSILWLRTLLDNINKAKQELNVPNNQTEMDDSKPAQQPTRRRGFYNKNVKKKK